MTTALPEGQTVDIEVDLGVLGDAEPNPEIQAAAAHLVALLKGSPHANNGFGSRFSLVLSQCGDKATTSQEGAPSKHVSTHGSSASDWYDREDQMSRPANRPQQIWE